MSDGKYIGVPSAIMSQTGVGSGVGFAIPAHLARQVAAELIKNGKVEARGGLGISIQELTQELKSNFKAKPEDQGVLINDVGEGSAAEEAGMQRGDIIVAFNGTSITGVGELRNMTASHKVGAKVSITVLRNGEKKDFSVTLKARPKRQEAPPQEREMRPGPDGGPFGGPGGPGPFRFVPPPAPGQGR